MMNDEFFIVRFSDIHTDREQSVSALSKLTIINFLFNANKNNLKEDNELNKKSIGNGYVPIE